VCRVKRDLVTCQKRPSKVSKRPSNDQRKDDLVKGVPVGVRVVVWVAGWVGGSEREDQLRAKVSVGGWWVSVWRKSRVE
jgi:hypothetical protein